MKKRLYSLMVAAAMLAGGAADASGEKSVGIIGGVTTSNPAATAGVYFSLDIINHLRVTPSVNYVFPKSKTDAFMFNLNVESPWSIAGTRFRIYPLGGLNVSRWNVNTSGQEGDSSKRHFDRIGFNVGGGLEWKPSVLMGLKIFAEGKYVYGKNFDTGIVNIGIGYVF